MLALLLLAAALPTPVESVVNAAYTAPPELAADVLLRIADTGAIASRAQRLDLLERAFDLAEGARYPLKMWPGALGLGESRESNLRDALDLSLSKLDLQCRAAKTAFGLDRERGREMFDRIAPPQPPPLACTDALAYRVDRYYDLAADIFERGFGAKERRRGEHVDFAARLLAGVTTPSQIEPAARLLGRLKLAPADYALLVSSLARAVAHIQADPRSFAATLAPGMLTPYSELAARCPRYGCSPVVLLDAMRTYLATHLAGPRCGDLKPDTVAKALDEFNAAVKALGDPSNPQPAPILADEIHPSRTEPAAKIDRPQDEEVKALTDRMFQSLSDLTDEARIRDFIAEFDRLKEGRHPDAATSFYTEGALYLAGATEEDIAHGPLGGEVIARTVAFFRDSAMLQQSPPEWYAAVRELLKNGGPEVTGEMRRTGGPVMAMYVDLERVLNGSAAQTSTRRQ